MAAAKGFAKTLGKLIAKRTQEYADGRDIEVSDEMVVTEVEMMVKAISRPETQKNIVIAAKQEIEREPKTRAPKTEAK